MFSVVKEKVDGDKKTCEYPKWMKKTDGDCQSLKNVQFNYPIKRRNVEYKLDFRPSVAPTRSPDVWNTSFPTSQANITGNVTEDGNYTTTTECPSELFPFFC